MKKHLISSKIFALALIIVLVCGTALSVTGGKKIKSKSVTLDATKVTLCVGDIATLDAQMKPINSTDSMKWTSSKPKVATVNKYGTVTAKAAGTSVIKVRTSSGKTAKCTVTVKKYQVEKDVKSLISKELEKTNVVSSDWKDGTALNLYDGQKLPFSHNGVTVKSTSIKKYHCNKIIEDEFRPYKYEVNIKGTVSSDAKKVYVYLVYDTDGGTTRYYPAEVNDDGTFTVKFTQYLHHDSKEFYIYSLDKH